MRLSISDYNLDITSFQTKQRLWKTEFDSLVSWKSDFHKKNDISSIFMILTTHILKDSFTNRYMLNHYA